MTLTRGDRIGLRPNIRRTVTWNNLFVLNNAANAGANSTFALYLPNTLNPLPIGITAYFTNSSGAVPGLYNSCRVVGVRARLHFTNQEAFGLRVGTYLGSMSPANNSLSTQATQQIYSSKMNGIARHTDIGPLTGKGTVTLSSDASNRRTLGVANVRGLSDTYTNSWDSTTDSGVNASAGLSLVVLSLAAVNQVSGVLVDASVDLLVEFFSPSGKTE